MSKALIAVRSSKLLHLGGGLKDQILRINNNGLIIGQSLSLSLSHYISPSYSRRRRRLCLLFFQETKETDREKKVKKKEEVRFLPYYSPLSQLSPFIPQTQIVTFQFEVLFGLDSCENQTELTTGALCCIVASRPLVTTTKSSPPRRGREDDDALLQWRTNFSFSPAGYTRDGLEQDLTDEGQDGFALSSSSCRHRKSLEFRFQQSPRWDSTSSASGGNEQQQPCIVSNGVPTRPTSSNPQCLNEENGSDRDSTAISTSFRSLLSLPESSDPWETPSKQPFNLTHCSYSQVFCNPVSDFGNPEPDNTQQDSSTNPDSSLVMSTRDHQGSPVDEASPNSNSNHMLLDVERSNETEVENPKFEPDSPTHQRCGVCKKLLSQKSPWCSNKILRSRDMPAAGVFPCHHVYHIECLDKVTPTAQTRDPLCPVCSNTIGTMEQPLIAPETLQMALRSLRRSHTAAVRPETASNTSNGNNQRRHSRRRSHKWEKLSCCLNISFSSST
ncbi:PREDICTED: uncharacterized protein LOC104772344 [Camelina sativa]|uniref:Uncharacterized protein LOC104772344 n=1 Tax=Camelina sativa TaxID=90675 RepID=A0ABM0Y4E0_CAMSA|nr:PREDICTED: uncharacterized protein LOC104772344 [Camelina sativa]